MAKFEMMEKKILEKFLDMTGGYVLTFSNRTFSDFFADNFNIDIYDEKYEYGSGSKANRLRAFWNIESNILVGESILKMIEWWESENLLHDRKVTNNQKTLSEHCKKIANKLINTEDSVTQTKQDIEESKFLEKEFKTVDIKTLNIATTMATVMDQRIAEIQICLNNKASLAAIFLIGSTLEGLLLNSAMKNPKAFNSATAAPKKDNKVLKLNEWNLSSLINVSYELKIIGKDVKDFSHALRDFRNYIHPHAQMVCSFNPDEHTAVICWQVLKATINDLSKIKGAV